MVKNLPPHDMKTLSSLSPTGTPKLQLCVEILFYEKNQKTRRKYLQQLKIKRRNHNKMGRKSKDDIQLRQGG